MAIHIFSKSSQMNISEVKMFNKNNGKDNIKWIVDYHMTLTGQYWGSLFFLKNERTK